MEFKTKTIFISVYTGYQFTFVKYFSGLFGINGQ